MIATADSKKSNKIWTINKNGIKSKFKMDPILPNNVINKCPAIILAVSRMVRVTGRIMFLTVSMQTMKKTKIKGVPWGTRWINISLVLLIQPNIRKVNQKGKAKVKFKTKCLVLVKI